MVGWLGRLGGWSLSLQGMTATAADADDARGSCYRCSLVGRRETQAEHRSYKWLLQETVCWRQWSVPLGLPSRELGDCTAPPGHLVAVDQLDPRRRVDPRPAPAGVLRPNARKLPGNGTTNRDEAGSHCGSFEANIFVLAV